ncbi:hypothetical protein SAMN04487907_103135 [Zunongwangia mangrovi]|uniref:Uncharacterized protein n=1 Tax=Zunongwangia mangrovi TaxID=1334022 RepID=A0A1I1HQ71_9FLAO|nr:hypothetical protein [Zunongwangia mangrovi]SFC26074.1 hypothetical protein SAMN04487907_103135 [Zunongwangia mangrovi]
MLDRLFLRKLTHKGKIAYWIIQLVLDALFIGYLFIFMDYNMDRFAGDGYGIVIGGVIAAMLISGVICLALWKKPEEELHSQQD